MPDFIPRKDSDLLSWSSNLSRRLSSQHETYHVTAEQASEYAAAQLRFSEALQRSIQPITRGVVSVMLKNQARAELVELSRRVVHTLGGFNDISPDLRVEIGLSPRTRGGVRVIAPPESVPGITFLSVWGRTVTLKLRNLAEDRVGRPRGVAGAIILTHVGDQYSAGLQAWNQHVQTTKRVVEVTFPNEVPGGSTIWFRAQWYSPTAKRGPASNPISINIPGGAVLPNTCGVLHAA